MSAACRAHHVCDAVSRGFTVFRPGQTGFYSNLAVMYSSTTGLCISCAVLFPVRRVISDADYGTMGLCTPRGRAFASSSLARTRVCDSKKKIQPGTCVHPPRCFRDPRFYGLGVRRDGWQRSSLELHCRRAVAKRQWWYACIIGVPRGTGTKFYTRVSPFTARTPTGISREFPRESGDLGAIINLRNILHVYIFRVYSP